MHPDGSWRLSPAFDLTYAYNPQGSIAKRQQMSLNGKREAFTTEDLIALAKSADIKTRQARNMIDQVVESVRLWPMMAEEQGVSAERIKQIESVQRLNLADSSPV